MSKHSKTGSRKAGRLAAAAAVLTLAAVIADTSFKSGQTYYSSSAMGSGVHITLYGEKGDTGNEMLSAIKNANESCLSPTKSGSDIYRTNSFAEPVKISAETEAVLLKSLDICEKSGGALNIGMGTLTELWGIGTDNAVLPSQSAILSALEYCDYTDISVSSGIVSKHENQKLDLGAIGKGYACDAAAAKVVGSGTAAAVIAVGGSVTFVGEKQEHGLLSRIFKKQEDWTVGIRDPYGDADVNFALLKTGPASISTSGSYEKFFVQDGKTYHHIFSPETGYPSDSGLLSVTVVSGSGLLSDALSTAAFVMGYESSIPLLSEYSAQAVFVFPDKSVRITPGLKDSLELLDSSYIIYE